MATPPKTVNDNNLKFFKQSAKRKVKSESIPLYKAQDLVARENGFSNWKAIVHAHNFTKSAQRKIPLPSNKSLEEDNSVSPDQVCEERKADFQATKKILIEKNKKFLTQNGVEFSVFEPTITGLGKSILDAVQSVRTHFELCNFHLYANQGLGEEHKVVKKAHIYQNDDRFFSTGISLYRPKTKKGDPRMWFHRSKDILAANNLFAIVISDNSAFVINISEIDLYEEYAQREELSKFLDRLISEHSQVSSELLDKLKMLSKRPLKAVSSGDTAIGMTIEAALGISANCDKAPDYKGIELKSARIKSKRSPTRSTLFAQVANWNKSVLKSSAAILDQFGYQRPDEFKLYCSVSSVKTNSQGLYFKYDQSNDQIVECHITFGEVARWEGSVLRARLSQKHAETFWIDAESTLIGGVEHFILKSVIHTKKPTLTQLIPLIENGVIEMDHLIKRTQGEKPRVSEKGPLFKMNKKDLGLLFPAPRKYAL